MYEIESEKKEKTKNYIKKQRMSRKRKLNEEDLAKNGPKKNKKYLKTKNKMDYFSVE